ncbi:BnaA01g28240D [Brassica napus]|uniref:BnaA01g28240D protein n=1 Tax=Brassica napus TaxID=3708 RepID=A0A078G6B6_BRANA|nr:BnaA01g28240D [Brassica napus]
MALSATKRRPHRQGTPLPGEVIMSDAGAGTSRGGGSQGGGSQGEGQQVDPGKKYGTIVNNNVNHWKCIFCYKVLTAGISRLKQHLVGGYKNAKKCPICPEHVRAELQNYMVKRAEERAALAMQFQPAVNEDDVEDVEADQPKRKTMKRKNRGPLDKFVTSLPPEILKGRQDRKGVFGACDKDLRDKACGAIARWFYDAGIPFNAATHDSFKEMTKLIGQYGMELKPPSMSKEVSEVVKDATMLFKLLDEMVEEVGEKNVIQVVTDNASNYVKAGKLLEAKRPHLFWTPCAAHCIDLMLEDIGKIHAVKNAMKKCMFVNAYIYCRVPLVNMMRRFSGWLMARRNQPWATSTLQWIGRRKLLLKSFKWKKEKYEKVFEMVDKHWDLGSLVFQWLSGKGSLNRQLHTKRRNRLAQSRLNDMVFVKYNRALQRRMKRNDAKDPILLDEIDDSNEWLMGKMDGKSSNDEDDDFVHDDEDLTWSVVSEAVGAEEPSYTTRGAKTPADNKGKGIASSSTQNKRHGPSASHLELVDEDDDDIEGEEGFGYEKDLEYEENSSESD